MKTKEEVHSLLTEIVTNMYQIRCLRLSDYFWNTYQNSFSKFIKRYQFTQKKAQLFNLILNNALSFIPILLMVITITMIESLGINIGNLFAIYSLLGILFNQAMTLATEVSAIVMMQASLHYINDILDEPNEKRKGTKKVDAFDNLEISGLSFRYSDTSSDVLENISLSVRSGEAIAIVGLSGSGKTTLVKLLSGLYEIRSGAPRVNGLIISEIDSDSYSRLISTVPQLPVYYSKTIRDNITLENKSYSDADVIGVLKLVNFWNEVRNMPLQLDTIVSGQGGNLSGGQIQKLSLARSLISSPELIILDEATSSLDAQNERIIFENLFKLKKTLIIITHRLSSISSVDRIYVMEKGNICENGSHEYLMQKNGAYKQLVLAQSRK